MRWKYLIFIYFIAHAHEWVVGDFAWMHGHFNAWMQMKLWLKDNWFVHICQCTQDNKTKPNDNSISILVHQWLIHFGATWTLICTSPFHFKSQRGNFSLLRMKTTPWKFVYFSRNLCWILAHFECTISRQKINMLKPPSNRTSPYLGN